METKQQRPPLTQERKDLLLSLAFHGLELTDPEYDLIEQKPFDAWPKDLRDKLRPYGAAPIK